MNQLACFIYAFSITESISMCICVYVYVSMLVEPATAICVYIGVLTLNVMMGLAVRQPLSQGHGRFIGFSFLTSSMCICFARLSFIMILNMPLVIVVGKCIRNCG